MSAIVDAIRAEREQLLAPIADKLAALDDLERMAAALNGAGETRPAKAAAAPFSAATVAAPAKRVLPPKSSVTRVGTDRLGDKARVVLTAIRSQGASWAAAGEIYRALPADAGITYGAIGNHLQRLHERQLIDAQGKTAARRYRAVSPDTPQASEPPPPALPPTAGAVPVDTPPAAAPAALNSNASRVLRSRILDHLNRRRLNEQSLADHLNAEREHVADILGRLLLEDKIVLDPDGYYRNPA